MSRLGPTGLTQLLTDIKTWVTTKLGNYVTTDTAQDIEGNKNFKGLLTTIPSSSLWPSVSNTSDDITLLGGSVVHVEQKSSGKLTDLSGGAWNVVELGAGAFFFRNNTGTDIRYKHLYTGVVSRIPVVSGSNRFINDVTPNADDTYSLGTSSLRWSSCYSNAYYLGTTAFGDIVTHNASEFLTSHPSITLSSNTTSTASPAHGGTFTCIDSVTQDTNGHITKVNTKTVTLPSNNNTDTKVKQYEGTTNNERPILSRYNSTEASQTANFVVYDTGVTSNPAKHTITASGGFVGNASSATKLNTARQINGTDFDGTSDITTAKWGTSRSIVVWDGPGIYRGTATDVDGSSDITLRLPLNIVADNFCGNATSATQFLANVSVTLTGDVTGTASSTAGWSVATTLADSGVTAGTYGPSADVTGSNNATISVPEITVDSKGRVTSVTNRTYKSVNTDSDKKVYQYYKSDDNVYRLLFSDNAGNTATSNVGAVYSGLNNSFYVNPSTGSLYATKLYSGGTEVKVTDYDTHIADTDIHVTTADKNRWNNQTYVFRYSSTALTPSSTNSNALLDNTDNLKVGDKVIDSSGVLFSITAIDTANSTFTIGTALIDLHSSTNVVAAALPIGSYIQFAGSQAPDGFLVCNGGEISRTTYSALFAVIGTTYGSGDGSTTFNLPDLTDRFLQGSTTSGTIKDAGLPNITGSHNQTIASGTHSKNMTGYGAFSIGYGTNHGPNSVGSQYLIQLNFNASHSNSIYGSSSTVQPPALTCLICIKY